MWRQVEVVDFRCRHKVEILARKSPDTSLVELGRILGVCT
jgi:hypothetical protein